MNSLIVYESRFGDTAQIARAIADTLRARGAAHLLAVDDVAVTDLDGIDLLVVGGPTHARGLSAALGSWLRRLPAGSLQELPVAAFDTRYHHARLFTGSAAHAIEGRLEHLGARPVAPPESFFVLASVGPLAAGETERAAIWARSLAERAVVLRPRVVAGEHWQPPR